MEKQEENSPTPDISPPWWKRSIAGLRQRRHQLRRPKRRSGITAGRLSIAVAILALLGYAGPLRTTVNGKVSSVTRSIRNRASPKYDQVRPNAAWATSVLDESHAALKAIDGLRNTYWSEAAKGPGDGQAIILSFPKPVNLDRVGFWAGATSKPGDFLTQPRPEKLHFVFPDGSTADVRLKDEPKYQSFGVRARGAGTVRIEIASTYSSAQGGTNCSIAEIELYQRR